MLLAWGWTNAYALQVLTGSPESRIHLKKLAKAALEHGGGDVAPAGMCGAALRRNLDIDALSDDSFEFLERLGILEGLEVRACAASA